MSYKSVNPYDGKLLQEFKELTDEQLETALTTATSCYDIWKRKTYAERAVIVAKAGAIMHSRVDEFARLMTLEMGKLINEARGEVKFSADILGYYATNAEKFLAPEDLHPTHGEAHMEKSPIGVILWSRGIFPTTNWRGWPVRN